MRFLEFWLGFSLIALVFYVICWVFVKMMNWLHARYSWKVYTPVLILAYTAFLAAVISKL